jgi:hypothetical protein
MNIIDNNLLYQMSPNKIPPEDNRLSIHIYLIVNM